LCGFSPAHFVRRNVAHCFMGGTKRRKQPERYAKWRKIVGKYRLTKQKI
jgi:hypothetical protein